MEAWTRKDYIGNHANNRGRGNRVHNTPGRDLSFVEATIGMEGQMMDDKPKASLFFAANSRKGGETLLTGFGQKPQPRERKCYPKEEGIRGIKKYGAYLFPVCPALRELWDRVSPDINFGECTTISDLHCIQRILVVCRFLCRLPPTFGTLALFAHRSNLLKDCLDLIRIDLGSLPKRLERDYPKSSEDCKELIAGIQLGEFRYGSYAFLLPDCYIRRPGIQMFSPMMAHEASSGMNQVDPLPGFEDVPFPPNAPLPEIECGPEQFLAWQQDEIRMTAEARKVATMFKGRPEPPEVELAFISYYPAEAVVAAGNLAMELVELLPSFESRLSQSANAGEGQAGEVAIDEALSKAMQGSQIQQDVTRTLSEGLRTLAQQPARLQELRERVESANREHPNILQWVEPYLYPNLKRLGLRENNMPPRSVTGEEKCQLDAVLVAIAWDRYTGPDREKVALDQFAPIEGAAKGLSGQFSEAYYAISDALDSNAALQWRVLDALKSFVADRGPSSQKETEPKETQARGTIVGTAWQDVLLKAEGYVDRKGFPGVGKLAQAISCSPKTLDKAIKHSEKLKPAKKAYDDARKQQRTPKVEYLNEVHLDRVPSSHTVDPATEADAKLLTKSLSRDDMLREIVRYSTQIRETNGAAAGFVPDTIIKGLESCTDEQVAGCLETVKSDLADLKMKHPVL